MSMSMTLRELRDEAKAQGLKRYSKLNKRELFRLLKDNCREPESKPDVTGEGAKCAECAAPLEKTCTPVANVSMSMTLHELRAEAKAQGFKRYSNLNKGSLFYLLKTKRHRPEPKTELCHLTVTGEDAKGAPLDKIFKPFDEYDQYWFSEQNTPDGMFIGGINLDGLFRSRFIPPRVVVQRERGAFAYYNDPDDACEYSPPGYYSGVEVKDRGGWLIPHSEYNAFKLFLDDLKIEASRKSPKTLFELAGRIVNCRRHSKTVLPMTLQRRIKDFKF